MLRTVPSNNLILFPLIILATTVWGFSIADNLSGFVFISTALIVFLVLFAYFREPNMAFLKIEEGVLKIRYLFKRKRNRDIGLYKIDGHIELNRYIGGEFVSSFPGTSDYLNYRWYFTPETFELIFEYEGRLETFDFNVNVIGFRYFMSGLLEKLHSINSDKLKTVTTNFDTSQVATSWASVLVRFFVDFD